MPVIRRNPTPNASSRYGAAAKYDFDNPAKWFTQKNVPILDEHEMTDERGQPIARVDKRVLEEIAANNNARVIRTGDPAPLIVGHTTTGGPEKPVVGYAVNYSVKPRVDPTTGETVWVIHCDRKFRPNKAHLIDEFPRTSVELWPQKKEIDPIAMLGGTTPERDLGLSIPLSRVTSLEMFAGALAPVAVLRYSRDGSPVYRYEMEPDMPMNMANGCPPRMRYAEESASTEDPNDAGADNDPLVAKVFQSKQWTSAMGKIDEMYNAIMGEGEQPPQGGGAPMSGGGGPPGDEEMRRGHGEEPVQFEDDGMGGMDGRSMYMAGSAYPGPLSTHIPQGAGNRYRRQATPMAPATHPDVIRLQRQNQQLSQQLKQLSRTAGDSAQKLSVSYAREIVDMLKEEGIVFGDTAEDAAQNEAEKITFLSHLDQSGQDYFVADCRKHYQRKERDPVTMAIPGTARYARAKVDIDSENSGAEDYEPQTPAEAMQLAQLQVGPEKKTYAEAIKFMRDRAQSSRRRRA